MPPFGVFNWQFWYCIRETQVLAPERQSGLPGAAKFLPLWHWNFVVARGCKASAASATACCAFGGNPLESGQKQVRLCGEGSANPSVWGSNFVELSPTNVTCQVPLACVPRPRWVWQLTVDVFAVNQATLHERWRCRLPMRVSSLQLGCAQFGVLFYFQSLMHPELFESTECLNIFRSNRYHIPANWEKKASLWGYSPRCACFNFCPACIESCRGQCFLERCGDGIAAQGDCFCAKLRAVFYAALSIGFVMICYNFIHFPMWCFMIVAGWRATVLPTCHLLAGKLLKCSEKMSCAKASSSTLGSDSRNTGRSWVVQMPMQNRKGFHQKKWCHCLFMSLPMSSLLTGAVQCSVPNAKGPRVTWRCFLPRPWGRGTWSSCAIGNGGSLGGALLLLLVSYLVKHGETSENWRLKVVAQLSQLQGLADGFSCTKGLGMATGFFCGAVGFVNPQHATCQNLWQTCWVGDPCLRQDPPDPARVHLSQFSFTEWLISLVSFSQQTWTMKKWSHSFTLLTSWSFWRFLGFRARSARWNHRRVMSLLQVLPPTGLWLHLKDTTRRIKWQSKNQKASFARFCGVR